MQSSRRTFDYLNPASNYRIKIESIDKGAVVGASISAIYGGERRHKTLDSEIHHSLRNEKVDKGELAYGYLFFPGKNETTSARAFRLGLR